MRVALDTNVLAYAEGVGDAPRCEAARRLVEALPPDAVVLPVQVLGELQRVLTGKLRQPAEQARAAVLRWSDAFETADSTWPAMQSAFDLSAGHGLQIWDALILSVAAEQRCRLLVSEDMQDGFTWRGVTVANPFAVQPHALLAALAKR
jgi:predicted nucleic acid-binding protein